MEIKWKKYRSMRQLRPETGEPLAIFFKTLIQLYLFYLFLYFWLTVSKRVSREIFLDIKLLVLAYEAATSWNMGIPCKTLKFPIKLYLVLLNGSKRLPEVISFEIEWMCRPIRQVKPETGESLAFFSKYWSNYICYVHFFIL